MWTKVWWTKGWNISIKTAEFLSYVALFVGIPFGWLDLHNHAIEMRANAEKERVEAAQDVYRDVDSRYTEFVKLCIDNPELDCYSTPLSAQAMASLSDQDRKKQRMLYTALTDLFEVAYVEYYENLQKYCTPVNNKPVTDDRCDLYENQWEGWNRYIDKFIPRQPYRDVWMEIGDEYDCGLQRYMNGKFNVTTQNCPPHQSVNR